MGDILCTDVIKLNKWLWAPQLSIINDVMCIWPPIQSNSCGCEVWFSRRCEGWLALPIPSTWRPARSLPFFPYDMRGLPIVCRLSMCFVVFIFRFWSTPRHTPLIHFVLQICEHKHSEPAQYHLRAVGHLQNMATKVLEAGTRYPYN